MRRILVATDLALEPDVALDRACVIASENCAELRIVQLPLGRPRKGVKIEARTLESVVGEASKRYPCVAGITARHASSSDAQSIIAEADAWDADLIVLRKGINADIKRDAPCALINAVLRRSDRAVLAVFHRSRGPYRRLLAMIDDGEIGEETLGLASRIGSTETVLAVHAITDRHEQNAEPDIGSKIPLDRIRANRAGHSAYQEPSVTVVKLPGEVVDLAIDQWREFSPDLIVAVTHGYRGMPSILHHSVVTDMVESLPFDLLLQRKRPSGDHRRGGGRHPMASSGKIAIPIG